MVNLGQTNRKGNIIIILGFIKSQLLYKMHMISFQNFSVRAFKILVNSWKVSIYCYTSYEMTVQFLWFQV